MPSWLTACTNCWCISTDHTTRAFLAETPSSLSRRCAGYQRGMSATLNAWFACRASPLETCASLRKLGDWALQAFTSFRFLSPRGLPSSVPSSSEISLESFAWQAQKPTNLQINHA